MKHPKGSIPTKKGYVHRSHRAKKRRKHGRDAGYRKLLRICKEEKQQKHLNY